MRPTLWLLAATIAMATSLAHAQGRGEEQPTPLRFTPGRPCVDYRGRASLFTLHLSARQRIIATATGLAYSGTDPADRSLTMRQVFIQPTTPAADPVHLDKASEAVMPLTGVYTIDLSPESQAGNPGELLICRVATQR